MFALTWLNQLYMSGGQVTAKDLNKTSIAHCSKKVDITSDCSFKTHCYLYLWDISLDDLISFVESCQCQGAPHWWGFVLILGWSTNKSRPTCMILTRIGWCDLMLIRFCPILVNVLCDLYYYDMLCCISQETRPRASSYSLGCRLLSLCIYG